MRLDDTAARERARELESHLMLLHGLHPDSLEHRVAGAVVAAGRELGSPGGRTRRGPRRRRSGDGPRLLRARGVPDPAEFS